MSERYLHADALVSTDWLAGHLDDESLRVFECTTYLDYLPPGSDAPYEVRSGRADYVQAHVAGAGFLDLQGELSDGTSSPHLRFTMPDPATLAAILGDKGIGDDTRVVLYTRDKPQWATRVWWMLRAIGFDRAAVLDGGWEKWESEGRAVSTEEPVFAPEILTPRPRPELFVDKGTVRAAMDDPEIRIINALAADLHSGETQRYGRRGRIPGSTNVPAAVLTDPETGALVPAAAAAEIFRAAGADASGSTILYCGGGIAATLDAFVLHQLGHERLAVYDASMSEWARDDSLPIETDG